LIQINELGGTTCECRRIARGARVGRAHSRENQIMDPAQITFVVIAVGVAVAGVVWLQGSEAGNAARRMTGMMTRVGLDPGTAGLAGQGPNALSEARRRCKRCPKGDLCDRWLAGEVEGGNAFCPNARTFRAFAGAGGLAA